MRRRNYSCIPVRHAWEDQAWVHGLPMVWVQRIRIYQAMLYLLPVVMILMQERVHGAADFCRVFTRVCNAGVKATRFYLSTTRMEWTVIFAALLLMRSIK